MAFTAIATKKPHAAKAPRGSFFGIRDLSLRESGSIPRARCREHVDDPPACRRSLLVHEIDARSSVPGLHETYTIRSGEFSPSAFTTSTRVARRSISIRQNLPQAASFSRHLKIQGLEAGSVRESVTRRIRGAPATSTSCFIPTTRRRGSARSAGKWPRPQKRWASARWLEPSNVRARRTSTLLTSLSPG